MEMRALQGLGSVVNQNLLPVHCTFDSDSRSPPGLACF